MKFPNEEYNPNTTYYWNMAQILPRNTTAILHCDINHILQWNTTAISHWYINKILQQNTAQILYCDITQIIQQNTAKIIHWDKTQILIKMLTLYKLYICSSDSSMSELDLLAVSRLNCTLIDENIVVQCLIQLITKKDWKFWKKNIKKLITKYGIMMTEFSHQSYEQWWI